jgi:mRNA interferase RelE/StbE
VAYTIQFTPAARRQFMRLEASVQQRIGQAIDGFTENPRPPGSKKMKGGENLWRIRVGDYRVVYQIHDRELVVVIVAIGHRSDIYRCPPTHGASHVGPSRQIESVRVF